MILIVQYYHNEGRSLRQVLICLNEEVDEEIWFKNKCLLFSLKVPVLCFHFGHHVIV